MLIALANAALPLGTAFAGSAFETHSASAVEVLAEVLKLTSVEEADPVLHLILTSWGAKNVTHVSPGHTTEDSVEAADEWLACVTGASESPSPTPKPVETASMLMSK